MTPVHFVVYCPTITYPTAKDVLYVEISNTVFREIDLDDKQFQHLLREYGAEKIYRTICDFHEEIERRRLDQVEITEPLDLLAMLLEEENKFNGVPLMEDLTDIGGVILPKVKWDQECGSIHGCKEFKTEPLRPIMTDSMARYLDYFGVLLPHVAPQEKVFVEAMAIYMGFFLKFSVQIAKVTRKEAMILQDPFSPFDHVNDTHFGLIVWDDRRVRWVFDLTLHKPILFREWLDGLQAAQVEFQDKVDVEATFDCLRKWALFEKGTAMKGYKKAWGL